MEFEVLYFGGCPSHQALIASLAELASEHGVVLAERRVETAEQAERVRFLGSPSVRVAGVDVEPGADQRTDFGIKCRLYRSREGQSGLPPREWIERALTERGTPLSARPPRHIDRRSGRAV